MNPSAIPQAPQQQAPDWVRALPTIGGTAGSFIGGALGGLVGGAGGVGAGALVPGADLTGIPEVAGGIAGGIGGARIGSVAGGGAGGGIGQAAEDFLTHNLNAGSWGRVGGSTLENAIGSLFGEGLVKGGGMLVKGAMGALTKGAEQRGAQAATSAAGQAAADAAKAAADRANAFKNNYGSLSSRLQQDLKLGSNAKAVDNLGFDSTNPADMKAVSQAGHELNGVYDAALQKAKPVDMSGFGTKVFADMQKNGITDLGTTPLGKAISEAQIPLDQKNLQLPATQVRQLQQAVGAQIGNTRKIINNAEMQGVSNTEAEAQLKNLQDVYKDLGTRIKTPEVDAAIASHTISDTDRAVLTTRYGDKLGNHIADTINNSKSADDLLKPMQRFTQMNHASDMALNDIENAPATARAVARTAAENPAPGKAVGPSVAPTLLDTLSLGGAIPTHGVSLLGLLPHALQVGKAPAVQDAALSGLKGITDSAASKIVPTVTRAGAIAAANLPNEVPQGGGAGSAVPAGVGTPAAGGAEGGGILNQVLQQQIANQGSFMDQAGRVPANFGGAGLAGAAASEGGIVAGLAPQVQKQQLASQAISGLLPSFENAGGAQGALGGLMTQATSLIPGSAANTYQREQATAAAALASLLGISPQEAAGLLPRLTQEQGTAGTSEQVLRNILGNVAPGSGSSIPSLGIPQLQLSSGQ